MIYTRSSFIYDIQITSENYHLDFLEGATKYAAKLLPGKYTLATIAKEAARALNQAGMGNYSATVDRATRKLLLSSSVEVTLLTNGDHVGSSCLPVLGITSNKTGTIIESDQAIGVEYRPQKHLQDYVSPDDWEEYIQVSENSTPGGIVEIISLGTKNLCQFNIEFITNRPMGHHIESNPQAVEEARAFLKYIGSKAPFDFLPNRDDSTKFYTLITEKLSHASNGTGFRLYEMSKTAANDIYETKTITCRVIK